MNPADDDLGMGQSMRDRQPPLERAAIDRAVAYFKTQAAMLEAEKREAEKEGERRFNEERDAVRRILGKETTPRESQSAGDRGEVSAVPPGGWTELDDESKLANGGKCSNCGYVKYEKVFQRDRCSGCGKNNIWIINEEVTEFGIESIEEADSDQPTEG